MSAQTPVSKREHALLIGDGLLLTATTSGIALGLLLTVFEGVGAPGPSLAWEIANMVLLAAGAIAGVVGTWWLHGRRITGTAVLGGLVGGALSGVFMPVIVLLAWVLGFVAAPFTTSEFAGPLAAAGLFGCAFLALTAWLLADAARDLSPTRRAHARLDYIRIGAAVALLLSAALVVVLALRPGQGETMEAIAFALIAGVGGALIVAGADAATELAARRVGPTAPPESA